MSSSASLWWWGGWGMWGWVSHLGPQTPRCLSPHLPEMAKCSYFKESAFFCFFDIYVEEKHSTAVRMIYFKNIAYWYRKLMWIVSLDLCYLSDELVTAANWHGGDGSASKDLSFLIQRRVDFMGAVIGSDFCTNDWLVSIWLQVAAYWFDSKTDGSGGLCESRWAWWLVVNVPLQPCDLTSEC